MHVPFVRWHERLAAIPPMRGWIATTLAIAASACACTPLRPLDPDDDAARGRDAGATIDVGATIDAAMDAAVVPLDARGPDAFAPDAPGADAPGADAPTADAPAIDAPPDAFVPDAFAPDAWVSPTPVTPSSAGAVVFSEILMTPSSGDRAEWVELYNPSPAQAYELRNCTLDGVATSVPIMGSVIVAPHTYVTLAASSTVSFAPDYTYGLGTFLLQDPRDRVALTCRGTLIDEVVYDETFPLVRFHSIMARTSVLAGATPAADNDLPASWCTAPDTARLDRDYGTPGELNPCSP